MKNEGEDIKKVLLHLNSGFLRNNTTFSLVYIDLICKSVEHFPRRFYACLNH